MQRHREQAAHRYALRCARTRDARFAIEICDEADFSVVARVEPIDA